MGFNSGFKVLKYIGEWLIWWWCGCLYSSP